MKPRDPPPGPRRPPAGRPQARAAAPHYPPSAWYPQGYALNLTDSIARLRYRNGRERGSW